MDDKEDEYISIDLGKIKGKIKGFLRSDKKEESRVVERPKEEAKAHEQKGNDEINIDFGKIKNYFKSRDFFKSDDAQAHGDDEIAVNWGKVISFFRKYGIIFIALLPVILSIYVRMQAGYLHFTDDWAINTVIGGVRNQIKSGIDGQYPNLPQENKDQIAENEFQKFVSQNKNQIDAQISQYSKYFKESFLDENKQNYMPDIDPYYWYRYVKNIIDHGHPGDILKDGRPFDNHQLAPGGRFVSPDTFHVYSLAYLYRIIHFFNSDISVMRSMFYYPVIVSALCVFLIFLIARKIAGNLGGFIAATIMAVDSSFLGRSLFGHADSDAWVVFFPILVTWLFTEAISSKNFKKTIVFALLAGFSSGMYAYAWSGWWFIFDFLIGTTAVIFLYLILINLQDLKSIFKNSIFNNEISMLLVVGVIYFISTALFTTLFMGWNTFIGSFLGPLSFSNIKAPVTSTTLWPNVLTTVAELNEGSVNAIINSVGGPFFFFISLIGLILAIFKSEDLKKFDIIYILGSIFFYALLFIRLNSNSSPLYQTLSFYSVVVWISLPIILKFIYSLYTKNKSHDFQLSILLFLWIVATIFASIKGIRFTLLLSPAFSVAFGVALGKAIFYTSKFLTKEFRIHKVISYGIMIVLLLFILVPKINGAIRAANSDIPIVNDAWYNTLTAIKQNSSENAIITSWWDFGHHFKAIADRPVTFDGTTQTAPPAHWVGRLLMISDEKEAAGILRMLDCGSNNAFNELYAVNKDTILSLKILDKIIPMSKKDAERELKNLRFDDDKIKKILSYSHCEPPEGFFIASEDMIGKSGVWSHFGIWNFERADLWLNARKMPREKAVEYMMTKFNYTEQSAQSTYDDMQSKITDSDGNAWIAPWPGYAGTFNCERVEISPVFDCSAVRIGRDSEGRDISVKFAVNTSHYDVAGYVGNNPVVRPSIIAFATKTGFIRKDINDSNLGMGITFFPLGENSLEAVLSSRELVGGMFTRMFYMKGSGLKYFKNFRHDKSITGTDIYTYKMDWEGKNATILPEYEAFYDKPKQEIITNSPKNSTNESIIKRN